MKIKRERQVRLDELLRLVWDGAIKYVVYEVNGCKRTLVDEDELILLNRNYVKKTDLFTITEEVEITEDTKLNLVEIYHFGHQDYNTMIHFNRSIFHILFEKNNNIEVLYFYLLNDNGSIGELIWDKERGLHD